ncbi:alpha-2-macroglobulin family protein [Comamonas sp.]|uniref:alpha-2-macroglobulin family protein n=1 Tax=Comamonas sp. TaxID=34028 RepID=UPI003A8D9015
MTVPYTIRIGAQASTKAWRRLLGTALLWGLAATAAQAVGVRQFSPQGDVSKVGQVVVQLDGAGVRFGDPKAAAPVTLQCTDAEAAKGTGRWNSEKEWVYDFVQNLPAGVRCTAKLNPQFKTVSGTALTGAASYQFQTGGPQVQSIAPDTWNEIDEQQYFALKLTGAATADSLQKHVWCTSEGVGERIPVQLITGKDRDAVLKQQGWEKEAGQRPQNYAVLSCNRRLTSGSKMTLVYGKGVAMANGLVSKDEQRYEYAVRAPFTADFSCERENANAACLPIRPMRLSFSAPVPRKLIEGIRLKSGAAAVAPVIEQGGDKLADDSLVDSISFPATMAANAKYTIELPPQFKDAAGRTLTNGNMFPLATATGNMPPLAKFAASPFGIVERFAEGPNGPALLPVTLRNVEPDLTAKSLDASVIRTMKGGSDADIIAWLHKIEDYDSYMIARKRAARDVRVLPPVINDEKNYVQTRMLSLLEGKSEVKTLEMPKASRGDPRPFEVVGIPLSPGFQVVEIASPLLGKSLLDEGYGAGRTMYVRTSALVTNLAVHFKLGRENSVAWVTTLDKGKVVAGATVQVSDCNGRALTSAVSNEQGIATFEGLNPSPPACSSQDGGYRSASYFVSARANTSAGQELAFTWSSWQKGIEPWRFNVPTSSSARRDEVAHTVFDRMLFRAGETVSMKHYLRVLTGPGKNSSGFEKPQDYPNQLTITHLGSGQRFTQALNWNNTSAVSEFATSKTAKLGEYQVELGYANGGNERRRSFSTGIFRVEEFRLPVMSGSIGPQAKAALYNVSSVPAQVQLNYVAGGAAANLPVKVSAVLQNKYVNFPGWDGFSFSAPRSANQSGSSDDEEATASMESKVVADKLAVTLDRNGLGNVTIDKLPAAKQARDLVMEATYADPNGEVQTISSTSTLWPAAVVAGIRSEGWISVDRKLSFQSLSLDTSGKIAPGVAVKVEAVARITTSSRKRLVGGFYSYDNQTTLKSLGTVCSGNTDSHGVLQCEALLSQPGEVELIVTASDKEGRSTQAATSVWVTGKGEIWFGGEDHDRMDVLSERKSYEPGETARFQVRMPFRSATALVAVEREGVISTQVVELNGQNPTVEVKVLDNWGPNVYVSVLALRGRLREVPWYSFFTWGFMSPREWWNAFWHEGKEYVAPTAMVDLSKPAFRFGMSEIRVGTKGHSLDVKLAADKSSYKVRGTAKVSIQATLPDGKPAAGARVAVAAVDQALLELMPNSSWNLLDAMLTRREWGVQTATAQMEVIGRRHYGKKAVPAGGGGGRSPTRELLDTLLLWKPDVVLDANGRAQIEVPLNDALTTFQVVAVADSGVSLFGTGQTAIRTTQDLQIISGLPPLVREDDLFRAQVTLRNTSAKAMKVEVAPRATLLELKAQTVEIPAGEAREVAWEVKAPAQLSGTRAEALIWEISARDTAGGIDAAQDALKVSQRIVPAVPLSVQQATLVQVDGSYSVPVAPPADALPGRGGLQMSLVPKLTEGLPGVRDWWARYPYSCLEQTTSKAVGMNNAELWSRTMAQLPNYLDGDGLANYFPPREGAGNTGSDTLTAHLLNMSAYAQGVDKRFVVPAAERAQMEDALIAFVEGRIKRDFWSPRKDLEVRKLAAISALALSGKATARMLDSINITPNQWPTHTVIDWVTVLQRMKDLPQRDERLAQAMQILRGRLTFNGTRVAFSNEQDDSWWWLMQGPDVNLARLILATLNDAAWTDDMPRLVSGFIGRQQAGAWSTTTANLWGALALRRFSQKFESAPVAGTTVAALGGNEAKVDWAQVKRATSEDLQGQAHANSAFGEPVRAGGLMNNTMFMPWAKAGKGQLTVTQQGTGKPWLTVQSVAAVQLKAPFASGYSIKRTVTPVEQADKSLFGSGQFTRGDVLRVSLEVQAKTDMTWVAITDPIPTGATILGGGLGRDSAIASAGEKQEGSGWLAYEERSFEAYRAYYQYLPAGTTKVEYTVRLNNAGDFALPPTRVEALYAPEMFGESPNAKVKVSMPK